MRWTWYFIEPHDVWMFRDNKPFTAQQSFVARSMFPPTPQTMQGAIRTHVIERASVGWSAYARGESPDLRQLVGTPPTADGPGELGSLRLRGPFVARRENGRIRRLTQMPMDVFRRKEDLSQLVRLMPHPLDFETESPLAGWQPLRLSPDAIPEEYEEARGWLDDAALVEYMRGATPSSAVKPGDLYHYDERIGLGLVHERRVAAEALLYHAEFVRLCDGVGLLAGVSDGLLDERGILNLGGEARAAYYETVDYAPPTVEAQDRLTLVLLTPAYFSGGWQPANGDWTPWVGATGRLVSAVIGKPLLISGWDVARNRAKTLYHYVPAGSVYRFENAVWQGQDIRFTETPQNLETGGADALDHCAIGFGDVALGHWE